MFRRRILAASLVWLSLASGACSDKPGISVDHSNDAAIYASIIVELVQGASPLEAEPGRLPVLYLEPIGAEGIGLEVQIEAVALLELDYDVIFIDNRGQAVDDDEPLAPVNPGSAYLGLGDIVINTTPNGRQTEVRVERYHQIGSVEGFRFRLEESTQGTWAITEPATPIEPEVLVAPA